MADEPTQTQSSQTAYSDKEVFPVVLKPVWEPFGMEAEEAIGRVLKDACWPALGPKALKYRIMVSSFLKAVQDVYLRQKYRQDDDQPVVHLGIRHRNEAWSPYPLVGKDVGIKIVDELLRQCHSSASFVIAPGKWQHPKR